MNFVLWSLAGGLKMIAIMSYHRYCMDVSYIDHSLHTQLFDYSLLRGISSLSVGHILVPVSQSASYSACNNCPINLCLDYITAVQLHPDFETMVTNSQIDCPDQDDATMYALLFTVVFLPNIIVIIFYCFQFLCC